MLNIEDGPDSKYITTHNKDNYIYPMKYSYQVQIWDKMKMVLNISTYELKLA